MSLGNGRGCEPGAINRIVTGKIHEPNGYGTVIPERFLRYEHIFLKGSNERSFVKTLDTDGKFPGRQSIVWRSSLHVSGNEPHKRRCASVKIFPNRTTVSLQLNLWRIKKVFSEFILIDKVKERYSNGVRIWTCSRFFLAIQEPCHYQFGDLLMRDSRDRRYCLLKSFHTRELL